MNLGLLPVPPPGYWDHVPWWAYFVFLLIGLLAIPFVVQVIRGRAGQALTREQSLTALLDRLEREREAHARALREDCEACRAELAAERARWGRERSALAADRDDGWNAGRGMEDVAHHYRHQFRNAQHQNAALLETLKKALAEPDRGGLLLERLRHLVDAAPPIEGPPDVPLLRDVQRKLPPG
jgi:hypothetical protein